MPNCLDVADGSFGANRDYGYAMNGNRTFGNEGVTVTTIYEPNSNRVGSDDVILGVAGNTLSRGNWTYSCKPHH